MKSGQRRIGNVLIWVFLLTAPMVNVPARASASTSSEDPIIVSFEQQDLNGDTTADQAIIVTDYMGERHSVVVHDQGQDMKWSDDWRIGTDFANDVWLFKTEAGDQTKLIIRFSQDHTGYTAELFDDATGDGTVSYTVDATSQVQITESKLPIARFTAEQPWILPDGNVNYMVRVTAYGRLHNMISGIGWDVNMLPQDGRLAWSQEVVDLDSDSIPDYELIQVFPDIPDDSGVYRTSLNLNVGKVPSPGFRGAQLWPYLGYAETEGWRPGYLERNPGNHFYTPPVHLDWQSGRIQGIESFFPGYGGGDRYGFLSMTPLTKDEVNELHFDRFAHYYFSGSSMPDMFFRLIRDGRPDSVQVGGKTLYAQQVGFNWHHRNLDTLKWDYKLELTGLFELPSTLMPFKDFFLRDTPFEDLLWWFSERESAYATFVAAEENAYPSNEGIWEWMTLWGVVQDVSNGLVTIPDSRDVQREYILGESDASPAQYYTDIREGFRGEYGELNGLAQLYFSPIDRKLHLLKAQKGVWNLGADREIRYSSLGGEYIDQWTLLEKGQSIKEISQAFGYLILEDTAGIQLIQANVSPSLFATLPPRTRDEWIQLGQNLDIYKPSFGPEDFAAMVDQFSGPRYTLLGATMRDYRLVDQGFRFVLELEPGFSASHEAEHLFPIPESPGDYVVEFDGHTWSVMLATPAATKVSDIQVSAESSAVQALRWATLEVLLGNDGLEDAHDLPVCAIFDGPTGQREVMTNTVALLPSEGEQRLTWDWTPPAAGLWRVQVEANCADSSETRVSEHLLGKLVVEVTEAARPSVPWLMTLGGRVTKSIALFLAVTLTMAGAGATIWVRRSGL